MCTLLRTYTGHMLYSTSNARTEPPTMQHTTNQARAWKPYLENDMLFARAHIRRLEDVNCGVHPVHGATNRQTASTHAYLHAGYMHTCINYTHEHIQSYTNMQARKHPNKHTHTLTHRCACCAFVPYSFVPYYRYAFTHLLCEPTYSQMNQDSAMLVCPAGDCSRSRPALLEDQDDRAEQLNP